MLLSVILSTTLIFVSLAIGDSYASAQRKMAKGIAGTATISVSALAGAKSEIAWIPENAIPNLAAIKSKAGILHAAALYNKDGYFENCDIIAADLKGLSKINKPRLLDGSELNNFTGFQVVLPERFTAKYGLQPGDNIKLKIEESSYEFRIAAIAAYDTVFLRQTGGFYALVPIDTLMEILNTGNGYSEILIEPRVETGTDTLISELSASLPSASYRIKKIVDDKQVEADAREKSMPLFLISFFALTMSVFIIYSSYKVITTERLPVIGTFRSIGATQKAVAGILLKESLLYGILGGLLGIPLGLVVLKLLLRGLGKTLFIGIEIPMVASPLNLILSCVAAIAASLLSAYIPIRRASKLPIKDVVLGTVEEKNVSNLVKLGLSIIWFALSIIMPRIAHGRLLFLAGGFSLLGLIVATIIAIPYIMTGAGYLLEEIYRVVLGNEGQLAARNLKRNKNVNQNITLLFISISALIVISVVGSFVNSYIGDVFKGATMDGIVNASMDKDFVQKVKGIEGMKTVIPIYDFNGNFLVNGQPLGQAAAVENLSLYDSMLAVKYDSKENQNEIETTFSNGRNILISKDSLPKLKVKAGDEVSLSFGGKVYKYQVAGSYILGASNTSAIIPSAYAKKDFGIQQYGMLAFQASDPEAAIVQIRALFENRTNWSRTVKEVNADVKGVVSAFLDPLNKLIYFILLLATVGIVNNLIINYIQKRRIIALYKSVGLSSKQNIKMTLIEGFSSGLIGAILGITVAYLEIKTIFIVAGPRISMEPEFGAAVFIMAGAIGIVITLIGSIVPILKGSKLEIVQEIKYE